LLSKATEHSAVTVQYRNIWERAKQPALHWQLLLVVCVIALWGLSLRSVDLTRMTDLGLVPLLPPTTFAAFFILTASFCLALSRRQLSTPILLVHAVLLIFMIHSTPIILYGTLRYEWAWKHVGIVDYIQRHGSVNPEISYLGAYHNWPVFFILSALATDIGGFKNAIALANWGPPFFNLINLGALLIILKACTKDRRLIWLSIWFFYLGNWVGQDYFSPQAFSYFLYLIVLGICLTWFKVATLPTEPMIKRWLRFNWAASLFNRLISRVPTDDMQDPRSESLRRIGLMIIVFLLIGVIASSHQLTPFMVITALTALVIFQCCEARSLPILMGVLTASWIIYVAVAFLKDNLGWVIESIGLLTSNFSSNMVNVSQVSPGLALVANIDRALSAGLWGLAALGILRRLLQGHRDLPAFLLAISPFPLLAANSYGGEMVFRIYYFALPFVAFFAAALFYPRIQSGTSRRTVAMTILVSSALLVGLGFAYYGKEQQYYFTPNEVDAAEYVHNVAPKGALLLDGDYDWPVNYENYEFYDYLDLSSLSGKDKNVVLNDPVTFISQKMNKYQFAYIVITRSQKVNTDATGTMPAGSLEKIEQDLTQSPLFTLIYSNVDAKVFILTHTSAEIPR